MKRPSSPSSRGMSMVELLIVGVVGPLLVAMATIVTSSGIALYRTSTELTGVSLQGHRALQRMAAELRHARAGSVGAVPAAPSFAGSVSFDHLDSVASADGTPTWSPAILRLSLAPGETDDGADEDGDGLVDERVLELVSGAGTAAEIVTILATDVPELAPGELDNGLDDNGDGRTDEPGFLLSRDGSLLTLELVVARASGYSDVFRTTVQVRN